MAEFSLDVAEMKELDVDEIKEDVKKSQRTRRKFTK